MIVGGGVDGGMDGWSGGRGEGVIIGNCADNASKWLLLPPSGRHKESPRRRLVIVSGCYEDGRGGGGGGRGGGIVGDFFVGQGCLFENISCLGQVMLPSPTGL